MEWEALVDSKPAEIFISHRLSNDPYYAPYVSMMMITVANSTKKFLFRCHPPVADWRESLVRFLPTTKIIAVRPEYLVRSFRFALELPKLKVEKRKRGNQDDEGWLHSLARSRGLKYCKNKFRSIVTQNDQIDKCHIYHLALDLALMSNT